MSAAAYSRPGRVPRRLRVPLALAVAASLSACAGPGGPGGLELAKAPETTGSIDKPAPADAGKEKASLVTLARAHADKPDDLQAALAYARALKAAGKLREANAVLERLPSDGQRALLVERGLLALELGDPAKARKLLLQTSPETSRDWRVLSALGVAEASAGKQAAAQDYFKKALQISPDNPVVLNNLALSYILESKVAQGEMLLRTASKRDASQPRIGQNLALASALPKEGAADKAGTAVAR